MVRDPRAVHVVPIAHPRGCRSYVIVDPVSHEACVVDPLLDHLRETLDSLADQHAKLCWIVETHAHGDHLSGAAALEERTGATVVAHPAAAGEVATLRAADGESLALGQHELVVHHAPGITADSIVLEAPSSRAPSSRAPCSGAQGTGASGTLFTGDTLLIGTVGLRDAPGSDPHAWYETLDRIFGERDDATILHPGHDDMGRDTSTLNAERRGNRWLREDDRDAFLAIYRADERAPRKDADQILQANQQGLTKLPRDVEAASGFAPPTQIEEERTGARRGEHHPSAAAGAPSGFAGLLVLCGSLCAVGTVLGWWLWPQFHALSLVSALIMLGAGLPGLERRHRSRGSADPDFYYTGPSKFTGPES